MTNLNDLFPAWTEALGWSLLNSLWQALAIMLLVILALRIIPTRLSQLRYNISCAAMLAVILLNSATFFYLIDNGSSVSASAYFSASDQTSEFVSHAITGTALEKVVGNLVLMIEQHMSLIILSWIVGTMIFSLRMLSGWWYVSRLRSEAVVLRDEWSERLQALAARLHIDRVVTLAQSAKIDTPVVMGWLKPIVLVPVGMFSGLTTEQIETIFIHELAHIRRHDYLINLIQSFIETIFFFNPFIWIISNIIRREREFCCDDAVVTRHGNALAYAHALTQLEEVRLSGTVFALSLAADKNQLLNRIKRLMEKSVKNYSGKDRLIPVLLLVIGLVCASWLTIRTDSAETENGKSAYLVEQDTTIRKQKSARSSRTTIITFDEKGEPHEEIIEGFSGSEDLRPMVGLPDGTWDFQAPVWAIAPMPSADVFPMPGGVMAGTPMPDFNFSFDTIPGRAFGWRSESEWKDFSEEFEKRFKEKFGDFYKSNEKEMEKMLKELEVQFGERFEQQNWADLDALRNFELAQGALYPVQAELEALAHEQAVQAEELAQLAQVDVVEQMAQLEELEQLAQVNMEQLANEVQVHELDARALEEQAKAMEANMKSFEKALKVELVRDGYLGKDEELKTINWEGDGQIRINGKNIKHPDLPKYQKLHRKYYGNGSHFRIAE